MTPDRWQEVQALFLAASERPPEEQAAWLAESCAGDPTLRDEVLALLTADARALASPFISDAVAAAAQALAETAPPSRLGDQVGPYRLLHELGRGGMGTVYLAERADGQYHAQVAIKFVRGSLAAPELARRLVAERQILAGLTHPNIAWLLDGGTAADGTPFLVMEYVDGEAVDVWCERRNLGLATRLALFRRICAAVQYAHQALVVHRDLKPSNILVSADGTPKLVDFGIAKILAGGDAAETTATLRALTPAYAAPEQVRGGRITVATDVYGLGGVLYRLLAGRAPVDLTGASPGEVERRICEVTPPPPSAPTGGPAPAWHRSLRGDLDTIVLTALAKDPARRYPTAEALADDLARYEAGLPIRARPTSLAYRTRKFIRRHRAAVLAAAATGVVLAGYTVQLVRERDRARVESATATQVAAFLEDLFKVADPSRSRTATITARELLHRGASRLQKSLSGQPEVQASLMQVVGDVYGDLGLYAEARQQTAQALAIRIRLYGDRDERVAQSEEALGYALRNLGQADSAAVYYRAALAIEQRLHRGPDPHVISSLAGLADCLQRQDVHLDEAEALYRRALAMYDRLPPDSGTLALLSDGLAMTLLDQGRYDSAEAWLRQSVALVRAAAPVDSAVLGVAIHDHAMDLLQLGRLGEAESQEREALAIALSYYGPDHPDVASIRNGLAGVLKAEGKLAEAEHDYRLSLAGDIARLGPQHPIVGSDYGVLGTTLVAEGKLREAAEPLQRALAIRRRALGPEHPYVAISMNELAGLYLARGELRRADSLFRAALALRRKIEPRHHPYIAYSLVGLARTLLAEHQPRQAIPLLEEADTIRREALPAGHPLRLEVDSLLQAARGTRARGLGGG